MPDAKRCMQVACQLQERVAKVARRTCSSVELELRLHRYLQINTAMAVTRPAFGPRKANVVACLS